MENQIIIKMDTREKIHKKRHILDYFANNNIGVEITKLDVGDYCIKGDEFISIDTKRNLMELATNMFCDRIRFEKECIRAKNKGIKLIILIEEKFDKEKLLQWRPRQDIDGKRFLNIHGKQVYNEMKRYAQVFGVKFRFCHKLATGNMIIKLLKNL